MNCIERPQLSGQHSPCRIQHSVADPNQFEAGKNGTPTSETFFTFENQSA